MNQYFIAAHTISGGRFYTTPVDDLSVARERYHDYQWVVKYFGGGVISLLEVEGTSYTILDSITL